MASTSQDALVRGKAKPVMPNGTAALTIENGSIVFHFPGAFGIKAASLIFEGSANFENALPAEVAAK